MSKATSRSPYHLVDLGDLSSDSIDSLLNQAAVYAELQQQDGGFHNLSHSSAHGARTIDVFYENSTRTRASFEVAARALGAQYSHFDVMQSSVNKGESLEDTIATLVAMKPEIIVLRHGTSGIPVHLCNTLLDQVGLINAGDGQHAHPTQALIDLLTIRQSLGSRQDLKMLVVGDVLHSRVFKSLVSGLDAISVSELRLCGPRTLLPKFAQANTKVPVALYHNLDEAIVDVDIVISLRLQIERIDTSRIPSAEEYFQFWGLTKERLAKAKPHAIAMHPGPITRNIDVATEVADCDQSVILRQVSNGVAVRMAVLSYIAEALKS